MLAPIHLDWSVPYREEWSLENTANGSLGFKCPVLFQVLTTIDDIFASFSDGESSIKQTRALLICMTISAFGYLLATSLVCRVLWNLLLSSVLLNAYFLLRIASASDQTCGKPSSIRPGNESLGRGSQRSQTTFARKASIAQIKLPGMLF